MDKTFLRAAGIRALRTVCQTALAMIPAGVMIQDVDWVVILSTSALSGVVSMLTSISTGLPEVDELTDESKGIPLPTDSVDVTIGDNIEDADEGQEDEGQRSGDEHGPDEQPQQRQELPCMRDNTTLHVLVYRRRDVR